MVSRIETKVGIRVQFPFGEPAGKGELPRSVEIIIDVDGRRSEAVTVELQRFSPAFFTLSDVSGVEIGAFSNLTAGTLVSSEDRAAPGDIINGFTVGLGPTDPFVPAGSVGSGQVIVPLRVLIHGAEKAVREAEVLAAGLAGFSVGLYSVAFRLPEDLPRPIGPDYSYRVELVIEDGDDVFTSPQVGLPFEVGEHQITGVLDAAGGQALISPGSFVSVFGDFVDMTAVDDSIPLSENLSGFSVTFNDIPGAVFGVFDGPFDQSNVQVPWDVDVSSGKLEIKVHWEDGSGEVWSEPFEVDAGLASPGIYMFPALTTQAIVTNFKLSEEDDVIARSWAQAPGSVDPVEGQAAAIGGVVTIWCNGLGPVSPLPATGDIPPSGTVPFTDKTVRVFVGGVEAQVLAAVLQPTNVGLNQINAVIPDGVTPGDAVPIVIEVECADGTKIRSRDDVTIAVRAAQP